jgi:hypothetical protein
MANAPNYQWTDYAFISDFDFYLKAEVCEHNTAIKYLGDLKKIVLICVKRKWWADDPLMDTKWPDVMFKKNS